MRDVAMGIVTTAPVMIAFACLSLGVVFFWPLPPDPNACITTPRGKVSGLLGADFEFSDTNCDLLLSKDEAITVFASKPGEAEKTAIFKYDPGSSYDDVRQ